VTWIDVPEAKADGYVSRGIAATDLDGDGHADLAISNSSTGTISLLLSR
jgi:hypothetical protein